MVTLSTLLLAQDAAAAAAEMEKLVREMAHQAGGGPGFMEAYVIPALKVIGLAVIGYFLSVRAGRLVTRACERSSLDITLARFFGKASMYAIMVLVLVTVLSVFEVQVTAFAAVLGAATLAIGLAFQGTLGHFASGLLLLIFRPFKVGDFVEINGRMGTVYEIDLFNTSMDTPNNERLILPNGAIFGNPITNFSYHDKRRIAIDVGVHYESDIDKAREVLLQTARSLEGALSDPEPQVMLMGLGASSVDFSVRIWAPSSTFWPLRDKLTRDCKVNLEAAGIAIPFPQMDVHFYNEKPG